MRDAILGESSGIPTYGLLMCFSIAFFAYIFGTIIFERNAHKAVVNV
jgi:hypothetical protein